MLDITNKKLDIIKWRPRNTTTNRNLLFISRIVVCLAGTGLMFDGAIPSKTTSIATVLGIKGIGLIATQRSVINSGGE